MTHWLYLEEVWKYTDKILGHLTKTKMYSKVSYEEQLCRHRHKPFLFIILFSNLEDYEEIMNVLLKKLVFQFL
jgi:hypothetical protein